MGDRLRKDEIAEYWKIINDPITTEADREFLYKELSYDHFKKFSADLRKISGRLITDMLCTDSKSGEPQNGKYLKHYNDRELNLILGNIEDARAALNYYEKTVNKIIENNRRKNIAIYKGKSEVTE